MLTGALSLLNMQLKTRMGFQLGALQLATRTRSQLDVLQAYKLQVSNLVNLGHIFGRHNNGRFSSS